MEEETRRERELRQKLQELKSEEERLHLLALYLTRSLDAAKCFYLPKRSLPHRGLIAEAWSDKVPLLLDDITTDPRYIAEEDSRGVAHPYSLLLFPVEESGRMESPGMIVCIGADRHTEEIEELVPLKAGGQAIGVTLKQKRVEIPRRSFGPEDLHKVQEIFRSLEGELFLPQVREATEERSDEEPSAERNLEKDHRHRGEVFGRLLEKFRELFT